DSLSVSSTGGFTFATQLQNGQNYAVTVKTQPANPMQVCTATNGSGTVANRDVQTVAVACVTTFSIGATVNGLTGSGLVLQNNGVDESGGRRERIGYVLYDGGERRAVRRDDQDSAL